MLTFIKSFITYTAWLQKVTFLQKRYKSYILYYRVHNPGNRARRPALPLALAEFGAATLPPPPHHTPLQHSDSLYRTWGWGGAGCHGPVGAQSLLLALQANLSSQSFAPGHQVQPRGRGGGERKVGRERLGVHIHALGLPASESWGPRRNGRQHLRSGWGRKKDQRAVSFRRARRGGGRPQTGRRQGGNLVSTSS